MTWEGDNKCVGCDGKRERIFKLTEQLAASNKEIERQSTQLALLQSCIAQLDRLIAKLGRDAKKYKGGAK